MTISAKIIADSISPAGVRITTIELNYHRFIHSEFMTHRMFSRNASSSRAIPVEKMLKQVQETPAMPIHWGKNQTGMQAKEELCSDMGIYNWKQAALMAGEYARLMAAWGYHKQVVNRILEPFQWVKVIVTSTEWDNFFNLRLHPDAQPEMQELAHQMKKAMVESQPISLTYGEWHLPYVTTTRKEYDNSQEFWAAGDDTAGLSEQEAINCSIARCARVSYLNHDASTPKWEKDQELAKRLLEAGHMSCFEHQATPMTTTRIWDRELGRTHRDINNVLWSGNFRGFLQYRQLLNSGVNV